MKRTQGLGETLLAFGFYATASAWWLWPLPLTWTHSLGYFTRGTDLIAADVDLMVWVLAWDSHAILTDPLNLFSANSFYPAPLSLAFSEHLLGQLPLFAPTYWATGNPVLATNLLIYASQSLCGLGMYLLARRFSGPPAALVAGLLFAFHPWRLETLGHFYILGLQYIPLALWFTERLLDRGRRRDAVGLAVCLLLQLLSSFYLAYALVLAYGVYLPFALWRFRARLDRRRSLSLTVALAVAAGPFLLTSIPYLILREWGFVPSYDDAGHATSFGLTPYFAASQVRRYVTEIGMGPVAYLLAGIALLPRWRRHGVVRATGVCLVAVGLLLSFGPTVRIGGTLIASPYRLLQGWLPGFEAVRVPIRLVVVAQLGLGILVALGFERVGGGLRPAARWTAGVATVAAALWSFGALPILTLSPHPVGEDVPQAYLWLAENGNGKPLLELPAVAADQDSRRMYFSTFHWLPIIEGYSAYPSDFARHVHRLARRLPRADSLEKLTGVVDVGWILVHRNELRGPAGSWERLPDGLERAAAFGDDLIVRVGRQPPPGTVERLQSSTTTPGGVPLSPLSSCLGRIALTGAPEDVWPADERVYFGLEVKNLDDVGWPGVALKPRHVVRASVCLTAIDAPPCLGSEWSLRADVPPGGVVTLPVAVRTPPRTERARLDIQLVQVGDGPLERCGLAPLHVPMRLATRPAEPRGSYWKSCRDCTWDGTTLACACRDTHGRYRPAVTRAVCDMGYGNRDGALACEGP